MLRHGLDWKQWAEPQKCAIILTKLLLINNGVSMPKRTFQPKKIHRAKVHGFLQRMSSRAGRLVLKRRRNKGRARLAQ